MTNDELIAALEAATGPSRELDRHILITAMGWKPTHDGSYWLETPNGGTVLQTHQPHLTSSLDAALALVPEGWRIWRLAQPDQCGEWKACAISDCDYVEGQHVELPYAICIAALRARSAQP